MPAKERADSLLVSRGLCDSREIAKRLILAGEVLTGTTVIAKPSTKIASDAELTVKTKPKFVGRGGLKMEGALDTFKLDPTGMTCLDVGASTGGFTDCLLQRGAREVIAIDVGHGQLHERLRADERVLNREKTNARYITAEDIGGLVDIVVGDLSFISLTLVIPALVSVCQPEAPMVLLVKPQFEAGRSEVSKGRGIITDPAIHERVKGEVAEAFTGNGCVVQQWTTSPITGADGNIEFLVHATAPAQGVTIPGGSTPGGVS